MFIILFVLWLLLNGYFAFDVKFLQIVIFGLALSALIYYFIIKFTKWTFKMDVFFLKHIHLFIAFYALLFVNIVISNFKVFVLILKPHDKPHPQIVKFNVDVKNEILRTMIANAITITPGTITVDMSEDKFIVHCLKKEYFDGFENSSLVKIILRMEGSL